MVNYSIVMRSNPMDADAAKKAYASAQYSEVMDINRFAEHIASHGCVYKRVYAESGYLLYTFFARTFDETAKKHYNTFIYA